MEIKLLDLTRISTLVTKRIIKKITTIAYKGEFIQTKDVIQFERNFATYIGIKYCVGVASGTDAIHLAVKALNLQKDDEVLIPAMTFLASLSPFMHLGVRPILIDVQPITGLIDPSKIEKAITKKTKAILGVHLYGNTFDIPLITKIAKKYNIALIEDACQAHGTTFNNKNAGSFGDIGVFSFYPGKNLGAYGDAGAIVTNKKHLVNAIRMYKDHGQKKKYHHELLGYNSRLDAIQAVVLDEKLPYLDTWNEKRRMIAKLYTKYLKGLPIRIVTSFDKACVPNYHLFVIHTKKRNALLAHLQKRNISAAIHYPYPLHLIKPLQILGYRKGDFPVAEEHAKTCLSLPMFPELSRKEVLFIIQTIKNFYKTNE